MPFKISKPIRNSIREALARSQEYDPATMRISADDVVTAKKDPNKTFAGHDPRRYIIDLAQNIVSRDGTIREGY